MTQPSKRSSEGLENFGDLLETAKRINEQNGALKFVSHLLQTLPVDTAIIVSEAWKKYAATLPECKA